MEEKKTFNQRLDRYVLTQLPNHSRAFASKLIDLGRVNVNDQVQTKAGYRVRTGDKVVINYNHDQELAIPEIDIPILYEDKDCVVINKPAGLLTHSKGVFNSEPTVESWLRPRLKDISGERAGIVHRLDRATSGVMICAKKIKAQQWLQKQFANRKVKKDYVAVVAGHMNSPEALIDMPIERHPRHPQTFRVGANGKLAQTAFKVLKTNVDRSLIELQPATGRTHQLRVHLAHLHHPIVGDTLYRGPKARRLFLHAHKLEITLASRERKIFTAPVPKEFILEM